MGQTECVTMLLAGGEGCRLGPLTSHRAKPAVHFGGAYRIIDFTLSNCTNSEIDTVGEDVHLLPIILENQLLA